MHNEAQIILQQVFNKRSLNDVTISELKALTEEYPYFNAAQFLLAKKIRMEKGLTGFSSSRDSEGAPGIGSNADSTKHPALFFYNPLWFNFLMKQEFTSNEIVVEDELVMDSRHLVEEPEIFEENDFGGETGGAKETDAQNEFDPASDPEWRNSSEPLPGTEQPSTPGIFTEIKADDLSANVPEPVPTVIPESQPEPQVTARTEKKQTDESLEFEPFHTIDYFASQGIKLQQADLSKDKFGQQLRSFTEWLKSMKKIPAPLPEETGDPVVQEQVIQFAQVSNETKEIITETMAEVWSLQGNRQKAIDIYKKLSLLNPAKSAYFASKIDKLNS